MFPALPHVCPPQAKQYDEVVETYRSSMYALRRLILQGSNQQRTQVWGGGEGEGRGKGRGAGGWRERSAHRWGHGREGGRVVQSGRRGEEEAKQCTQAPHPTGIKPTAPSGVWGEGGRGEERGAGREEQCTQLGEEGRGEEEQSREGQSSAPRRSSCRDQTSSPLRWGQGRGVGR